MKKTTMEQNGNKRGEKWRKKEKKFTWFGPRSALIFHTQKWPFKIQIVIRCHFFRVGGFNQLVRDSSQMEYTKCHQLTKSTLFNTIQLIQFWPTHAENVYNPTKFIWVLTVSKYNGRNVDGTNGTQQSEQHIKRDTKRYWMLSCILEYFNGQKKCWLFSDQTRIFFQIEPFFQFKLLLVVHIQTQFINESHMLGMNHE